jgi:hypothetical protein
LPACPEGLDQDELIERWTLVGDERERSRAKRGANGLGFALLWTFFLQHARFHAGVRSYPMTVARSVCCWGSVNALWPISTLWSIG